MKEASKKIPTSLMIIFIILTILIIIASHYIYSEGKKRIKREKQGDLLAIAELKVKQIVDWKNERLRDAMVIQKNRFLTKAIYEYLKNPEKRDLKDEISFWMRGFKETYRYKSIILLNKMGEIVLYISDEEEKLGPDAKRVFDEALNTKRIQFSDIYRSKISNVIRFTIAVPLLLGDGEKTRVIAVVILRIDPYDFLFPFIQTWPVRSETAETIIIRREGDEILFLSELRHKKDSALILRQPLSDADYVTTMAVNGIEGVVEGLDYRRVPVVAGMKKVPDTTWYLIAKMDIDEAFKPIEDFLLNMTVITILVIISTGSAIGMVWRHQRSRYYEELYKEELKHRALLRHFEYLTRYANDVIILTDEDLNIVEANDRAVEFYGYSEDEMKWMNLKDLYPEEERASLNGIVERIDTENGLIYEAMQVNRSGERFIAEISARYFDIEKKRFYQFIIRDITEKKKNEEELKRYKEHLERLVEERTAGLELANKELEAFSYSVSHDLRAPLRSIDGFSQVLLEDYGKVLDRVAQDYLRRIRNATLRMEGLIDDLLNLSRITRSELTYEEVDLSSLAKEVIEEQIEREQRDNVNVRIHDGMKVKGDAKLLRIMLENFFSNALKFTSRNDRPEIEFGMTEIDGKLTYFVRDNGVGFDMSYVDKLFKPFQRLHSLKEFPGTGIGLAIIYRIIKRHGGVVWAEGEVGKGARFYFRINNI
jgi:PAS domain S-box-containing protein